MKIFAYSPLTLSMFFIPQFCHAAIQDSVEVVTVHSSAIKQPKTSSATGLSLSADETPQSVTVLDSDYIDERNLSSINEVLDRVIGIGSLKTDDVRNEFQSRGFDITSYQIDGMPYSWGDTAGFSGQTQIDTSIYDRVEVIRGSTGLTTGVGDPSASINLVRKHADSEEFKGDVSASVGSWNNQDVYVDIQNALNANKTIRGRVVAKYAQGESYVDLYDTTRKVLYAVVEGDLDESTLLRVGASYQSDDTDAAVWGGLPGAYSDGSPTNFSRSKTTATDWSYWDTEHITFFTDFEHAFANGWQLTSSYNHTEFKQEDKLFYVYGSLASDGSGLDTWPYYSQGESTQDSFSLKLDGTYQLLGREHEVILGTIYSRLRDVSEQYAVTANGFGTIDDYFNWDGSFIEPTWADTTSNERDFTTTQVALYTATRLNISNNTKAILGTRIANWQRKGENYGDDVTFGDNGIITPYAGLLYDLSDNSRLYASYATIYEPQNKQDRNGDYLDPLEGQSYEIGIKSHVNQTLTVSGALYQIQQNNLAQDDAGYTIPNTTNTAQKAVDGTTSKGIEVQVSAQPIPGMELNLGLTQFQAEDADGNDVNTRYARKQIKLSSNYQFIHWDPALSVGVDMRWQSKIYVSNVSQPEYSLVDLIATYDVNKQLSLRLNIENVFDKTYYNYIDSDNGVRYGAPVNAKLSMNYSF